MKRDEKRERRKKEPGHSVQVEDLKFRASSAVGMVRKKKAEKRERGEEMKREVEGSTSSFTFHTQFKSRILSFVQLETRAVTLLADTFEQHPNDAFVRSRQFSAIAMIPFPLYKRLRKWKCRSNIYMFNMNFKKKKEKEKYSGIPETVSHQCKSI